MPEEHPLLFVEEAGKEYSYQRPPVGGGNNPNAPRYGDRLTHANTLCEQLTSITSASTGFVRLSVNSSDGKNFPLEALDKSGMKLLAVERDDADNQHATVLITNQVASAKLTKKINNFRDRDTRTGKPCNENLIGRISSFSAAGENWIFDGSVDSVIVGRKQWLEIWISRPEDREQQNLDEEKAAFINTCSQLEIPISAKPLVFPECLVFSLYADKSEVLQLAKIEPKLRKCRPIRELSTIVTNSRPMEQTSWTQDILRRIKPPLADAPSVCVLDSGCNMHPILKPLYIEGSTVPADIEGHGTGMAGIAAYGNLNTVMMNHSGSIHPHRLEAYQLYGTGETDYLHGEKTKQAVYEIEAGNPDGNRLFCMAITSDFQTKTLGVPSSWSAALDDCAAMSEDDLATGRLIAISAGNCKVAGKARPEAIEATAQNPSQAWNVLTVGASTHLVHISEEPISEINRLYAQDGGLSPHSTNSLLWEKTAPIKPDIVCEGGNMIYQPSIGSYDEHDDLSLIAPYEQYTSRQYTTFNGTSLATALVSHMGASIMRKYNHLRPETVRALIVHSAEWTAEMKDLYLDNERSDGYLRLARICGHGEPSLERALYCIENGLTLVHEGSLSPYKKDSNAVTYNKMAYHELPWPVTALQELGDSEVELKVTLSYFIEPSPSALQGLEGRYIYPSCQLRFSVRPATVTREQHMKKVNAYMREDGEDVSYRNRYRGWQLGDKAFLGSIHSDIWKGSATDLAQMGGIAIYPENGWWKTRKSLKMYDKCVHYSLVVSIRTQETNLDLYTPVRAMIDNQIAATNDIAITV